jgi:hypothetical protein
MSEIQVRGAADAPVMPEETWSRQQQTDLQHAKRSWAGTQHADDEAEHAFKGIHTHTAS